MTIKNKMLLGALLLGNLAVWGLWRWSWHSLVTRQSGRILTFAALPMAVSEYPWALHLRYAQVICCSCWRCSWPRWSGWHAASPWTI